jgi:hypothetical protein
MPETTTDTRGSQPKESLPKLGVARSSRVTRSISDLQLVVIVAGALL